MHMREHMCVRVLSCYVSALWYCILHYLNLHSRSIVLALCMRTNKFRILDFLTQAVASNRHLSVECGIASQEDLEQSVHLPTHSVTYNLKDDESISH